MATQVGEAVIKLSFDGGSVKSDIGKASSTAENELSKFGSKAKAIGKVALGTIVTGATAAAAATLTIGKSALQSYADYEQLVGGVETLFKDGSDAVFNYANQAYKTAGLSANQYMEQATSFSARLIQGLGGDTKKAAEYANKAIVDMSDNANKMGTDISMIQSAYQGFAKQNYTMLDNLKLGYGGTASEMARLINDSGVLGKSVKVNAQTVNSVSFDKMIEAIHIVQDNLGITGTTAKEASETISGSVNSMKSSWANLLTGVADGTQDINGLVNNFVDSLGTVIGNIEPVLGTIVDGIGKLAQKLAPLIPSILETVANAVVINIGPMMTTIIPALLEGLVSLVNVIAENAPMLVQALIDTMVILANALTQNLPTLLNAVINGIIQVAQVLTSPDNLTKILNAAITLLLAIVQAIPQIIIEITNALPQILDNIIMWLTDPATIEMLMGAAAQLFMALVMAVPQILGALIGAFGKLVASLWNGITKLFGKFAGKFGDFIGGIFKGAINGVLGFIENFINGPIDLINGFLDVINGAFGWVGVHIDHIGRVNLPRLAEGGYADGATTAIIGEAGKEVVLPLENNTDNWAGLLASKLSEQFENQDSVSGRPITVNMTNEINNEMDAQDIGRVLMESIRRSA